MKIFIPLFALLCMTSSCVTLLADRHTRVKIKVPAGTYVVCKRSEGADTTLPDHSNNVSFSVLRSHDPLIFTVNNDTIRNEIKVRPVLTDLYYANIYWGYGIIGLLVDSRTPKRFGYPRTFIEMRKTDSAYRFVNVRRRSYVSGVTELMLFPPMLNGWAFNMNGLSAAATPLGAGIGLNYYYDGRHCISGEAGIAGVTIHNNYPRRDFSYQNAIYGPSETNIGWYATLRHHHRFGRLDMGYGLSWGQRYARKYYTNVANGYVWSETDAVRYNILSVGASASASFRITNTLYAGINYMPQLAEIGKSAKLSYGHMITFGVYWRIRLTAV